MLNYVAFIANIQTLTFRCLILCCILSMTLLMTHLCWVEMKKWYVMYKGRVPGVYTEWAECEAHVDKFRSNSHKSFKTRQEAEASYLKFLEGEMKKNREPKNFIIVVLLIVIAFLLYVIIV